MRVLEPAPLASLPAGGGMSDGETASLSVSGILTANAVRAVTTGVVGDNAASAQSTAGLSNVNILNGLIAARTVLAIASSASNRVTASSSDLGSTIVDLVVNGVALGTGPPAPNMRIDLPNLGRVILNEQQRAGDGLHTSSLTVNMIHVVLTDSVTGTTTGEIVVGSARSDVAYAP